MTATNGRSEFGLEIGEQGSEQHDCREHISFLQPDGDVLDADIYICDVCGREFLMVYSRVALLGPNLDVVETYEDQLQSVVDGYGVSLDCAAASDCESDGGQRD